MLSLLDLTRLDSLVRLVSSLGGDVKGDVVECGVFNGGSALYLAQYMGHRHLWCYDSFQGMPQPTDSDGPLAKKFAGQWKGSVQHLHQIMHRGGINPNHYTAVPGWFSDTLFAHQEPIALLHIDADWYTSVLIVLEGLYDKVSEGGIIVLDDFGHWEGCRLAFYDFCEKRKIRPLLERVGYTQAWWIKGKQHNRH